MTTSAPRERRPPAGSLRRIRRSDALRHAPSSSFVVLVRRPAGPRVAAAGAESSRADPRRLRRLEVAARHLLCAGRQLGRLRDRAAVGRRGARSARGRRPGPAPPRARQQSSLLRRRPLRGVHARAFEGRRARQEDRRAAQEGEGGDQERRREGGGEGSGAEVGRSVGAGGRSGGRSAARWPAARWWWARWLGYRCWRSRGSTRWRRSGGARAR